jgi:hypothetical protein
MSRPLAAVALAVCCALLWAGCVNPDAPQPRPATVTGSPGEPAAPPPRSPSSEASSAAQPTPQKTLERFARLYVNWNYQNLPGVQRELAANAVGAARAAERLAAAQTARDQTLTRGRVWNHGAVVAVAPDRDTAERWVVVTREQTGGSGEYKALPAGYHVTLARVVRVTGGWAVEAWEPQS